MENLIHRYIGEIVANPTVNILDIADSIFGNDPLVTEEKQLVVPELGDIHPTKRNVAKEIILKKTGYHVEPAYDMFLDHLVIIDKVAQNGN